MKKLSLSVVTIFILSCFYANSSEKSDFALAKNLDIFNSIIEKTNYTKLVQRLYLENGWKNATDDIVNSIANQAILKGLRQHYEKSI